MGYRAASLNKICTRARATKGALFHYFSSKKELGLAVIQESLKGFGFKYWIGPIKEAGDPIIGLKKVFQLHRDEMTERDLKLGCLFQKLSEELVPIDADFRAVLNEAFHQWCKAIECAIDEAKKEGLILASVNSNQESLRILANFYGAVSLGKTFQSRELFLNLLEQIETSLETLRSEGRSKNKSRNEVHSDSAVTH